MVMNGFRSSSGVRTLLGLFTLALLLFPAPLFAQEKEAVRLSEQTIYVPYDQLEKIFEAEGRGVFLPYKEFIELWTRLTPALERKPDERPPVDGVMVAAEYSGKVEGKVAVFDGLFEFKALKEGYSKVPLGAQDLAISEARVASSSTGVEGDAFLAVVDGITTAILPGPGTYRITLRIMVPVEEQPGRKQLRFTGPSTAVSRFQLQVPEENIEFTLRPAAAFTHEPVEDGNTLLSAFFGSAGTVEVAWSPARVETEQPAVVFADVDQRVTFAEGSTHCSASIRLQILLAKLSAITFTVPPSAQVLSVNAPNLKSWDAEREGDRQTVRVELHSPTEGRLAIDLSFEIAAEAAEGERPVPALLVDAVRRQSGNLSIFSTRTLELRAATTEGVSQEAVPAEGAGQRPLFVFRYLQVPYRLSFIAARTMPKIEADVYTLVQVGLEKWAVQTRLDYQIKKAGVFQLALLCPEGFRDPEIAGGMENVDDYRLVTADGRQRLEIDLKNKIEGPLSLTVRTDLAWATPDTDTPAVRPIPWFHPVEADRVEGYLGVAVHPSLVANTEALGGMRAEDIRNLGALPAPLEGLGTALTLGFRSRGEAERPQISFLRRKSRVGGEVLTLAEVREAFLKITTTLAYQVDYAGVDTLSFRLPAAVADDLNITGPSIKEKAKTVEDGTATWTVTLQNKQLGRYELKVEHERPYERAAAAAAETASTEIQVPRITPLNVYRETGFLAILKDGNLEVTPAAEGLEAIDNKELPQSLQQPAVFLAYKYDRAAEVEEQAWALSLSIVRHAYVEVPASIVETALLRTALTEEGQEMTEITYYVQNKRAQYLELELPEGARILSDIMVGDAVEQPSRRESDGKLLIRLGAAGAPNQRIPVRLVYDVTETRKDMGIWGKTSIYPPALTGTRILQTWWMVYLPEKYDYTKFSGPMREDYGGRAGWHRWRRYFAWAIPDVGIPAPEPPQITGQAPRVQAAEGGGLKVTFVEEGKRFILHRLAEPASVTAHYRKRPISITVEILAFVIAVIFGVVLVSRGILGRVAYCVIAGVGAVVLSVLVSPRAAAPYQCFYLGVFVLAIVWAVSAWMQRPRRPKPPRPGKSPMQAAAPPVEATPEKEAAKPKGPEEKPPETREEGPEGKDND